MQKKKSFTTRANLFNHNKMKENSSFIIFKFLYKNKRNEIICAQNYIRKCKSGMKVICTSSAPFLASEYSKHVQAATSDDFCCK